MKYLDQHKISHVGAGKNDSAAFKPVIKTLKGIRVAYLGFSRVLPTTSWMATANRAGLAETYNPTRALNSIRAASKNADLIVVLVHWGKELADYPVEHQKKLAKQYIDAGADLIIGSHPHTLQGFEQYKGKWIAYSLGNFIFTTSRTAKTWDSGILSATCDRKALCQLQLEPILTKFGQPKPLQGAAAKTLLQRISKISMNAKIDANGKIVLK
jgi:poly-gamma-glutamate synthesis protein (capsule biosynthesis protein)